MKVTVEKWKWCIVIIENDALEEKPKTIKTLKSSLKRKITLVSGGGNGEERTNSRVMEKGGPTVFHY